MKADKPDYHKDMHKAHVNLTEVDRTYLTQLIKTGQHSARLYKRALALLELDRGQTYVRTAEIVGVSNVTLSKLAHAYRENGLLCLQDQPKSGRPVEIDGLARAKITALACSEPPAGYGQWSLRLLAEKIVELEYCDHISHTQVASILKKTI
ncbi:MAG: helix-turn-helix domain-containing protein [Proteobacteria bacterium]|nr:helix-turn-helix domain-containing protein [Pseudomonadota bacterium]